MALNNFLGDGDGSCSLSAYMFQYGSNWQSAFNSYQDYFCMDVSNYSDTYYIKNFIPVTQANQLKMARIIWKLKTIKMSYKAKGTTGCQDTAEVESGPQHESGTLNYKNANTGLIDPSLDTDYNRHLYYIDDDGSHSELDGTGICPNDPPYTPSSQRYHNHQINCSAYFEVKPPSLQFRYFFNGDTRTPSNLLGMGFVNLVIGQLKIDETGASQNPTLPNPSKRHEFYNLGSIVPKTADASLGFYWWGGGNPTLEESGEVSINGLDFSYTIGRNTSFVSGQTGQVHEQDVNSLDEWQSLKFEDAVFK